MNKSVRKLLWNSALVNPGYFSSEFRLSTFIIHTAFLVIFVALLAVEPIGELLNISPLVALVLVSVHWVFFSVVFVIMWNRQRRSPDCRNYNIPFEVFMMHVNLAVIAGFIIATGNILTPLWGFYFLYASICGNCWGIQGYVIIMMTLAGVSPGIWAVLSGNAPPAPVWAGVVMFTFIGVWQYIYIGMMAGRTRTLLRRNEKLLREQRMLEEKEEVSHEIHDGVGAQITSAVAYGHALENALRAETIDRDRALEILQKLQGRLQVGFDEIREALWTLDSESCTVSGVLARLNRYMGDMFEPTGIAFDVRDGHLISNHPDVLLAPHAKHHVFRMLQESVTNAVRHADATEVSVESRVDDGHLSLIVQDNGNGIGKQQSGFGLRGMQRRTTRLGGRMDLEPGDPEGTRITMSIPLHRISTDTSASEFWHVMDLGEKVVTAEVHS
jgi:signal transduction histidine kinase